MTEIREYIERCAVRELSDNPHLADWCRELREGDRRQGQHAMRTEEGTFCCMGVACDIAGVELISAASTEGFGVDVREITRSDVAADEVANLGHMPDWLRDLLGLTMDDENELSTLNDDSGYVFAVIADVLEHWYRSDLASVEVASNDLESVSTFDV